jgi:GTP diphosphokinase / guanosine-3',5'-bis(diphosphate) 3'-diphosphatase
MGIHALLKTIKAYHPNADRGLVERAYTLAEEAHSNQTRLSGEPYINHCLATACILAEQKFDVTTIAAGLLHDVIEDTSLTRKELETEFTTEIADLVVGVTKLNTLLFKSSIEHQMENLRKMLLAMAKDIRVILIKLADRLHNMRTLSYLDETRQKRIAKDTLEIYAPLANRLGMANVKSELEDLSLKYLYPDVYNDLSGRIDSARLAREKKINDVIHELRPLFTEAGIKVEMYGRAKHFFSIYKKMQRQGVDLDQIYDLSAIRILTQSVRDCYAALGIIHGQWKPISSRFKDMIAVPKSNMYQSIHTTVIREGGEMVEIQVRTHSMNKIAEMGIAAHWRYKEDQPQRIDEKFDWLRQMLDWQKDLTDPREFMKAMKIDLFSSEVFVFTPKGEVRELPLGSTPIDFAYSIHTLVGHACIGSKVNNSMVPLRYKLQNGDVVEIITSKNQHPSQDWLKFVRTSKARNKIRSWLRKRGYDQNLKIGRDMLAREIRSRSMKSTIILKSVALSHVAMNLDMKNVNELLAGLGSGLFSLRQIMPRLITQIRIDPELKDIIKVDGQERKKKKVVEKAGEKSKSDLMVRFANCCSPLQGEPIVGFITKGRGISIHRADCASIAQFSNMSDRFMEMSWQDVSPKAHIVDLSVSILDRKNILAEILEAITSSDANITSTNARMTSKNKAQVDITMEIKSAEHLEQVMRQIRNIDGVVELRRVKRQTSIRQRKSST